MEFDAAFGGLHARAYRVAYRLLGSRPDAEDVAAETLARAYLAWPRVSAYADAWVARVAANVAVDAVRRQVRAQRHSGHDGDGAEADPRTEERMDLYRALRALSRRQREVVVLRYLADLPEQEVATALSCSVGSVKVHASRGLAALRLRLHDAEAGA